MKRIAYECPIQHIADIFYRVLHYYHYYLAVSLNSKESNFNLCVQGSDLMTVELEEDPISSYFDLFYCPQVLNLPEGIDQNSGEILRKDPHFSIETVYDNYDKSMVELKPLLDDLFYTHGRIRPHERILCWFPKYLEYFI